MATNGPAARAASNPGDFIVALGGQRIDAANTYDNVRFSRTPGETLEATVRRGDQERRVQVTLRDRPPR